MTVNVKQATVKTLVKEALETLGANHPVIFAKSVDVKLDEKGGSIEVKFKVNKNFTAENVKPENAPQTSQFEVNGLEFTRGEKTKLLAAFKEATANLDGFKATKIFGATVELREKPALVIAFEDDKIVCRRENGKTVKASVKNICEQVLGEAPKQTSSSSSSDNSNSDDSNSDGGLTFARGEKTKLQKEFNKKVAELDLDKAEVKKVKALFGTTIEIRNKPALVISLDGNKVVARRESGATCNSRIKTIFDNMETKVEDCNSDNETSELKLVTKSTTSKEAKPSKLDKARMEVKFQRNADKLEKEGMDAGMFYKCFKHDGVYYRMIAIDVKKKAVQTVNIKTGKAKTFAISKLLAF